VKSRTFKSIKLFIQQTVGCNHPARGRVRERSVAFPASGACWRRLTSNKLKLKFGILYSNLLVKISRLYVVVRVKLRASDDSSVLWAGDCKKRGALASPRPPTSSSKFCPEMVPDAKPLGEAAGRQCLVTRSARPVPFLGEGGRDEETERCFTSSAPSDPVTVRTRGSHRPGPQRASGLRMEVRGRSSGWTQVSA